LYKLKWKVADEKGNVFSGLTDISDSFATVVLPNEIFVTDRKARLQLMLVSADEKEQLNIQQLIDIKVLKNYA
ncbi:MAG: hypothetical protein ACRCZ2_03040, partial [Fusobacteriaceae bacterium]